MTRFTANPSHAHRVTLVMACLFLTTGVVLAFLPRWLEVERQLSGAEIGAVLSLSQLARIFTGVAIAAWADNVADRRTPMRIISASALVSYLGFFFVAHDFWQLLAWGFVALSLTSAMNPLVEAAVLRATAEGKLPYGVARAIGSGAFIVANVAGGALVAQFGVTAAMVWILASLSTVVLSSWGAVQREPATASAAPRSRFSGVATLLRSRRYLILIVSCGLIQSGHAFYYGFSTLVWRGQGIAADIVGWLWAFGVLVEVLFLLSLAPIERRVSPEFLILMGAAGGVVRWLLMGLAPTGLVLWPLQGLHVLSFAAAHVGAMRLLYREAPPNAAIMAQTLYGATSSGILMGLATLLSGGLYDAVGAKGYWAMAGLAAAGGALAILLLNPSPRSAPTPQV